MRELEENVIIRKLRKAKKLRKVQKQKLRQTQQNEQKKLNTPPIKTANNKKKDMNNYVSGLKTEGAKPENHLTALNTEHSKHGAEIATSISKKKEAEQSKKISKYREIKVALDGYVDDYEKLEKLYRELEETVNRIFIREIQGEIERNKNELISFYYNKIIE